MSLIASVLHLDRQASQALRITDAYTFSLRGEMADLA